MTPEQALTILQDKSARDTAKKVQEAINILVKLINPSVKEQKKDE